MDDATLVGVHGLHGKAAAGLAHLGTNALCQGGQVALALVAVAGHVQTQLDVIAFQTVGHQACQIGQALHGLAAAADQGTQVLTVQTDDGGFALLHGAEGHVLHAHLGNDFLQVLHSSLDLGVLFDHDGDLGLLVCGCGSSRGGLLCGRLLNLGSRCFHRCGRLFHGGSGNFRGSLLHRSSLGRRSRGCGGRCRSIGFFHAHAHLGRGGFQAQETGFLGHLQHFIADIQIIGLYTQQSAGFCAGFIDRLAGRFLLTDHNRSSSFIPCPACSAHSAARCARPCNAQRPADGHTPGGACSSRWQTGSFPRSCRSWDR